MRDTANTGRSGRMGGQDTGSSECVCLFVQQRVRNHRRRRRHYM